MGLNDLRKEIDGIDTRIVELIANRLDEAGIAREIGADSVRFLSLEALRGCVERPDDYCTACFSGKYPCPVKDAPVHRKC